MKTIKQIAQDLKQAISDRDQKLALDLFRAGLQQSEDSMRAATLVWSLTRGRGRRIWLRGISSILMVAVCFCFLLNHTRNDFELARKISAYAKTCFRDDYSVRWRRTKQLAGNP
jgi:hypothetical protein